MKVLLTGSEGYIGTMLADLLMQHGHDVIGVDTGFYKDAWLYKGITQSPRLHQLDIRQIQLPMLKDIDTVIHLAELSNDPMGQLEPRVTYAINHQGSVYLANLAKQAGVRRFIYTSSCSVYGVATGIDVTEESPLNPQTVYAECKTLVERDVSKLADKDFSPVFLRNATLFGASPRIRFDIVLNNLSGLAWTQKQIRMVSDGTPWRPLIHIADACQAILHALNAPKEAVHNQILNVGDTRQNYQVLEIAKAVAQAFPDCELSFGQQGSDNRSYRVSFAKIAKVLPEFRCQWTVLDGARQLIELYKRIDLTREQFESRQYTRLLQIEHLLRTGQLDRDFFWTMPVL